MQASKHFKKFKQRFAAANTSSEHRQTQHVQQERSPRSVPRSSAKRTKVNTARPESAAKTRSSQQQAVSSHSGRSLSKEHQQPASTKPSRRHEVPAAVADPLGAFASRGGLKQRSLQSGLKLLKGKASGPVDPGLQPAHCSFPEQLVRQQVVVSKARPQHHHQVQTTADSLQKYAYAPQQKQAKIKLTGNCQQQDVQQVYSTVDPQSRSQASKDMQAAAPASSAVPTAKTIDPHYMQKVKKSLCQLMQDRHRLQLESNLTAGQPLVSLLASKLDGVNITAALAKYRNQVPPGQKHAAGKSNSAQQAHSAARSSVACTPSPEAAAEPNHMPEQVTSSWQRHAADMAHLPAQHTCFRHVASTCTMTTAHLREHFRPMHSCLSLRHSGRSSQLHQHSQFKRRLELSDDSQLDQYAELSGNNQSDFVPYEQPLTDGHNSSIDMLLHSRYDQQQHSDMDLSVSDDDGQPDSCHWRRMQLATPSAGLNRSSDTRLAPGAFPEILLEPACSSDWQEQQDLSVLEVDQQQHVDSVLGNRAEVQYELDSLFGDTQATRGFARVKSDDLDWNMSLQGQAEDANSHLRNTVLREFLSDQQEAWPLQSSACSLPSDRHQHIGTGAVLDLQRQQASNQADLDILCSSKRHRWDEHQDHVGMYMDGEAGITIDHLSDIDGTLQSAGHERLISQGQFDNMQPLTIGDVLL